MNILKFKRKYSPARGIDPRSSDSDIKMLAPETSRLSGFNVVYRSNTTYKLSEVY